MQFTWNKTDGTSEPIDTNTSRSSAAANYLAKNWPTICAANVVLLSEALKWIASFEYKSKTEARTIAIDSIDTFIRRLVGIRYADAYLLAYSTDSDAMTIGKNLANAAQQFACSYQQAILVGRWGLHPSSVRDSAPLPVFVLPDPTAVVRAMVMIQPPQGGTEDQLKDSLMARIGRVMEQMHPFGRDWILADQLWGPRDVLFTAWAPYFNLLPLDPAVIGL